MTYTIDGDIGYITPDAGTAPSGGSTKIDSTKVIDSEQIISLTSPTVLDFTTITWKVRFPENFDRAFLDKYLKEQQPDALIDGWTGYTRFGSYPFFFMDTDDEWFEVHGAVDDEWWQFLFIGLGQALFTDGTFSVAVDIEMNAFYYVSMSLNPTLGQVTLSLTDSAGTTLASNTRTGASLPMLTSSLGATGKVYNIVGDRVDATDDIHFHTKRQPGQTWDQSGSTGYIADITGGWDVITRNLGTCAGITASPWTQRPYWASCPGKLDYTFYNNRTVSTWYEFHSDIDPPDGYPYLMWKNQVAPAAGSWTGRGIIGYASPHWPTGWHDGENSGMLVVTTGGWQAGTYFSSVDNFRSDNVIFFGLECALFADMPPWYICGGGGDVPWLTGAGNSYNFYEHDYDWEFFWAADVVEGEDYAVEFDWISIGDTAAPEVEPENTDNMPMEGWNTEMVSVVDGLFDIGATPVRGSVNVFSDDGGLLYYGVEWEEAEETEEYGPGRQFKILSGSYAAVVVVYFVSKPVLGNSEIVSRPTEEETYQTTPRGTRTSMPV